LLIEAKSCQRASQKTGLLSSFQRPPTPKESPKNEKESGGDLHTLGIGNSYQKGGASWGKGDKGEICSEDEAAGCRGRPEQNLGRRPKSENQLKRTVEQKDEWAKPAENSVKLG